MLTVAVLLAPVLADKVPGTEFDVPFGLALFQFIELGRNSSKPVFLRLSILILCNGLLGDHAHLASRL